MLPRGQASREGEICSFLRHCVHLLAEGVAGPARICNAGASFRDTKVAPRGRGGQEDRGTEQGYSAVSSLPPCAHKGRPYGCLGHNPAGGRVSVPRGQYARAGLKPAPTVCEGSTHVRMFQEGWRDFGIVAGLGWIGGKKWRRRGEEVGRAWGWMGQGRERVARESDAFFGVWGSEWVGCGGGCAAGVCVGASGGHLLSNMANARRWP